MDKEIAESKQMLDFKSIGLITVAGFLAIVRASRRSESSRQIQNFPRTFPRKKYRVDIPMRQSHLSGESDPLFRTGSSI